MCDSKTTEKSFEMKISYSWLKDYIKLEQSPEEICDILTQTGLEVGGLGEVETIKGGFFMNHKNIRTFKVYICNKQVSI